MHVHVYRGWLCGERQQGNRKWSTANWLHSRALESTLERLGVSEPNLHILLVLTRYNVKTVNWNTFKETTGSAEDLKDWDRTPSFPNHASLPLHEHIYNFETANVHIYACRNSENTANWGDGMQWHACTFERSGMVSSAWEWAACQFTFKWEMVLLYHANILV